MTAAALPSTCSNEGSSTPRSLTGDEAAFEPWDSIGVVTSSDMRYGAPGPGFERGTLALADGNSIEITDATVRIDGCAGAEREVDPAAPQVAYDHTDCLAFLDLASGAVTGFAGYGSPVDRGFADDPCAVVV